MHDDDSARMVVLAKRGWLGAKTCKLDERGLGRLHMLGRTFSIIKCISKESSVPEGILFVRRPIHLMETLEILRCINVHT